MESDYIPDVDDIEGEILEDLSDIDESPWVLSDDNWDIKVVDEGVEGSQLSDFLPV